MPELRILMTGVHPLDDAGPGAGLTFELSFKDVLPISSARQMKLEKDFLLWSAGASPDILAKCPASDTLKQSILGTFVLLTGIIAGLGSFYAFYSSTASVVISLPCALLWATLIFTLDRLVVSSISVKQTQDTTGRTTYSVSPWQAVPRGALAALIGLTVALPVELFIFRDEILQANLRKHEQLTLQFEKSDLAARREAQTEIESRCELKVGTAQLTALVRQMDNLQARIGTTIRGKDGTGETCGPVCRDLMAQQARIREEHAKLHADWKACIATETTQQASNPEAQRITELRRRMREHTDRAALSPSFLTQYKELRYLAKQNDEVERASIFLPLLFIFFELVPVIAKVIAGVSTYELLTYRERTDAVNDAAEHTLNLDVAGKHRIAEHDRNQELLVHQRAVVAELHKTIDSETCEHFLVRFRTLLPTFDNFSAGPGTQTGLEKAITELLHQKIRSLISLCSHEWPPVTARRHSEIDKQEPSSATSKDPPSDTATFARPGDSARPAHVEQPISSAPPVTAPTPPRAPDYRESFVRKAVESIASKTPDVISYLFTNSAAFVAGFPAVLLGLSSATGLSALLLFPLVLGAFVLGRRLASASRFSPA
ncbi:hypothetical protein BurJ1DRAFT_3275 [Burkholderiales bacterium JOSHI_001]|nr:hypothetical protein BurJ1DRAFT_3275 [Burkholderiales bacterium JOSHI_001]